MTLLSPCPPPHLRQLEILKRCLRPSCWRSVSEVFSPLETSVISSTLGSLHFSPEVSKDKLKGVPDEEKTLRAQHNNAVSISLITDVNIHQATNPISFLIFLTSLIFLLLGKSLSDGGDGSLLMFADAFYILGACISCPTIIGFAAAVLNVWNVRRVCGISLLPEIVGELLGHSLEVLLGTVGLGYVYLIHVWGGGLSMNLGRKANDLEEKRSDPAENSAYLYLLSCMDSIFALDKTARLVERFRFLNERLLWRSIREKLIREASASSKKSVMALVTEGDISLLRRGGIVGKGRCELEIEGKIACEEIEARVKRLASKNGNSSDGAKETKSGTAQELFGVQWSEMGHNMWSSMSASELRCKMKKREGWSVLDWGLYDLREVWRCWKSDFYAILFPPEILNMFRGRELPYGIEQFNPLTQPQISPQYHISRHFLLPPKMWSEHSIVIASDDVMHLYHSPNHPSLPDAFLLATRRVKVGPKDVFFISQYSSIGFVPESQVPELSFARVENITGVEVNGGDSGSGHEGASFKLIIDISKLGEKGMVGDKKGEKKNLGSNVGKNDSGCSTSDEYVLLEAQTNVKDIAGSEIRSVTASFGCYFGEFSDEGENEPLPVGGARPRERDKPRGFLNANRASKKSHPLLQQHYNDINNDNGTFTSFIPLKELQPEFDQVKKSLVLHYTGGRVVCPSSKNYVITKNMSGLSGEAEKEILMQFGKKASNEYILDFKGPISRLQAFGMAIGMFFRVGGGQKRNKTK